MRWAVWIVAAALVALAGVGVGLASRGPSYPPSPYVAVAHAGKLRISVPRGFYRYTLHDSWGYAGTQAPPSGQVLTDAPVGDPWLSDWFRNGPPANEVGLSLDVNCPCALAAPYNLNLPLTLNQGWYEQHLANGHMGVRAGDFRIGDFDYHVEYWSGPDAPRRDRVALLRALRSIRPGR